MSKTFSTPLTMIQVDGSEATDFIQNMFCNDVMELGAISAQFSGLCNPKGRLLANGFLLRRGQGLGFLLHRSMSQAIMQRLNMYKLRADVDIKANAASICFARDQPAPEANPDLNADLNPGAHYLGRYQSNHQSLSFYAYNEAASETINSTWDGTLQNLGLAIIEELSSAQFVPQMINMDQLDGVSFNKGCYPGQEIVARLHFLGKLKQRSHAAQLQNHNQSIAVGDQIFVDQAEGSASVGTVTHVFRESDATRMLLSLKDRALQADSLVNQQNAPISITK